MERHERVWLTPDQARRMLGLETRRSLYALIDTGKLPAYRFGTTIRLRTADVRGYLERGEKPPDEG